MVDKAFQFIPAVLGIIFPLWLSSQQKFIIFHKTNCIFIVFVGLIGKDSGQFQVMLPFFLFLEKELVVTDQSGNTGNAEYGGKLFAVGLTRMVGDDVFGDVVYPLR